MKVIFLQTVGKSYPWEIKSVKPGYFRNFLLPKRFAVPVSDKIIIATEQMRKEQETLRLERVEKLKAWKVLIEWKVLEFKVKSDWGHMYASINEKDIADRILEEFSVTLEPKSIKHTKLKDIWESDINVSMWDWITAIVKINIISDQPKETKKWSRKPKSDKKENIAKDSVEDILEEISIKEETKSEPKKKVTKKAD